MIELLKSIYQLKLAPVSEGINKAVEILKKELPFTVHQYPSLSEHNGWIVPQKWEVKKAEIRKNGELIYNGKNHPLGVIGYSQSFKGKVKLTELKKHLFYKKDRPNDIVYHCDLYYKPHQKNWGFCIPYNMYKKMKDGEYDINLQTSHENGKMKVLDYFVQGKKDETIILNAHNCHAGQANDDISGVVVGIELMKRLSKRKTKYSYRLIIAPEHLGTVFYLANLPKKEAKNLKFCIFLEMLGNDNRFALQLSFTGESLLDKAACNYLSIKHPNFFCDKFRKIVGNDETVWEAPGFEIPTISLSRWPYPEYHTDKDNEDIISEKRLEEAVEAVLGILNILETNCFVKRRFDGLLALSNPKYNLYIRPGTDPSIKQKTPKNQKKWNYLMDCLPRYFDGKTSILDIAIKHALPYDEVYEYINRFKEKGLVEHISERV